MGWLSPALAAAELPVERASDCGNCPMAGAPFHEEVHCCTYHPALPNFLVGRAIRRGGVGADQVLARLADPDGRDAWGLRPPSAFLRSYRARGADAFGTEAAWTCPMWVPGPLSCSIWQDRNSVCRTWHCKHDDGREGFLTWSAVRDVLYELEDLLARHCREQDPPPRVDDGVEVWAGFYIACAERVDALTPERVEALRTERLGERNLRLAARLGRDRALPDVLAPHVKEVIDAGEEVVLVGYSPWNPAQFPRTVFALLAAMDGQRAWSEALLLAQQTAPAIEESWVRELYRVGVLRARTDLETEWGFEGDDLEAPTAR